MLTLHSKLSYEDLDKKIKDLSGDKISLNLAYLATHNLEGSRKNKKINITNKDDLINIKMEDLDEDMQEYYKELLDTSEKNLTEGLVHGYTYEDADKIFELVKSETNEEKAKYLRDTLSECLFELYMGNSTSDEWRHGRWVEITNWIKANPLSKTLKEAKDEQITKKDIIKLINDAAKENSQIKIFEADDFPFEIVKAGEEESANDYFKFYLTGGLNGSGKWKDYLKDLFELFKLLEKETGLEPYIIDENTDCADDVFTIHVGLANWDNKALSIEESLYPIFKNKLAESKETDILKARSIIADQIRGEWDADKGYTKAAADLAELKDIDTEEAQKMMLDIASEEHVHVGELETAYDAFDPHLFDELEDGHNEADEKAEPANALDYDIAEEPVAEGLDLENEEECAWCHEKFPKSELEFEKDFGPLCHRCIQAIKSREGEDSLEFKESLEDTVSQDLGDIRQPIENNEEEVMSGPFNYKYETAKEKGLAESAESNKVAQIEDYIERLYELRKKSIAEEGEYSIGNLVFKELRNKGYLDKLRDLKASLMDKDLSLENLSAENIQENLDEDKVAVAIIGKYGHNNQEYLYDDWFTKQELDNFLANLTEKDWDKWYDKFVDHYQVYPEVLELLVDDKVIDSRDYDMPTNLNWNDISSGD